MTQLVECTCPNAIFVVLVLTPLVVLQFYKATPPIQLYHNITQPKSICLGLFLYVIIMGGWVSLKTELLMFDEDYAFSEAEQAQLQLTVAVASLALRSLVLNVQLPAPALLYTPAFEL